MARMPMTVRSPPFAEEDGVELSTFSYSASSGWSEDLPDLDSERTLVVAFGAPGFGVDTRPFADLARAFPRASIAGCSTAGEILGTDLRDDSVVVAAARFATSSLRTATAAVGSVEGSFAAGADIARRLADPRLRGVIVLSDGLTVNGSELVRGLNSVLPPEVVVTGGLAADGDRFGATWVLGDEGPAGGIVRGVGLYGDDLRLGHGSRGGWDIFGPERTVTRSRGNVLYELDGRPALELYKSYLGELSRGLPATGLLFPLALRTGRDEPSLVRTILAVDEEESSLTFAGDMPEGARAQLMRANFDRLVEGAADAALMTRAEGDAETPTLALGISCVGRRLVLGERTQEEIEAVVDCLPGGAAQIGFYSYGEISPHATGTCELHNQTMTLTTIGETAG
jgi:hypothetical protein